MAESDSEVVVVMSALPTGDAAAYIARTLVDERLCACVSIIGNVRSYFNWDGGPADDAEQLAIIKTTRGKVDALLARLPELHPNEVPEALVLPIVKGLPAYLAWVAAEVDGDPPAAP